MNHIKPGLAMQHARAFFTRSWQMSPMQTGTLILLYIKLMYLLLNLIEDELAVLTIIIIIIINNDALYSI